jgi:hypothetical protein
LADDTKWDTLAAVVKALAPAYKLLRLVDGHTPTVGKIYYKSQRLEESFTQLVSNNSGEDWCKRVLDFWKRDWGYMHCDLHSLGFCTDPEYQGFMDRLPSQVWDEFIRCAKRMLKAAPASDCFTIEQLTSEFSNYQNLTGVFNAPMLEAAASMPAHIWWQQWGRGAPALRFCAMRGLAQTTAASCSEQAWSEYGFIHSRKRNRLKKAYTTMLVRGHNQARLIRKMKKVSFKPKCHDWTDSDDDEEEAYFSD